MWCALLLVANLANQSVAASHNAQSAARATPSLWQLDSTTILPPSTLNVALSAGALRNPVMCTIAAVVETQTLGERELQVPLELSAGLKYQRGPLEVRGAFGGGLIDGVGAPQQRATVGVSYRFGTDFPERRPFRPASILALSATPPTADEARRQTQEQDQKRRRRCPPGEMVPGCPPPSAPKAPPAAARRGAR